MHVTVYTDGGVRTGGVNGPTGGKSGIGAVGFVIKRDKEILRKGGMLLEGEATVNECEYGAVILGLYNARMMGATSVLLRSDSQLVVNQMTGKFACRDARLKAYLAEALAEAAQFESFEVEWVKRTKNQHADQITRELLDEVVPSPKTIRRRERRAEEAA